MSLEHLSGKLQILVERALIGLDRFREHVVFVGGQTKFFYLSHPDFRPPDIGARATLDVDIALDGQAESLTEDIHRNLLDAQLVPYVVIDADGNPAEQQYQLKEDGDQRRAENCLEFLVPNRGTRRRYQAPRGVQPNELRYVDLLLERPMAVTVEKAGALMLPHPLSYVVQKTLIRSLRKPPRKRASDQADVFFVVWGFQPAWSGWAEQWQALRAVPSRLRWLRNARNMLDELYRNGQSTGSREVSEVYSSLGGNPIEAGVVSRIMRDFIHGLPP